MVCVCGGGHVEEQFNIFLIVSPSFRSVCAGYRSRCIKYSLLDNFTRAATDRHVSTLLLCLHLAVKTKLVQQINSQNSIEIKQSCCKI